MSEPFAPHQPEVMVKAKITAREAHLIKVLRHYDFGKIVVHKANGLLIRVEPNESQLINEEDGMDLVEV